MDEMTHSDVPMPTLLNPDRQVISSRGDSLDHDRQSLIPALERSDFDLCAYGQQVWNDVNAMRTYLLQHLPTDHWAGKQVGQSQGDPVGGSQPTTTTSAGDALRATADANGQVGRSAWIAAYAGVTSVLTGPLGDSDFGVYEAHRLAGSRPRTP